MNPKKCSVLAAPRAFLAAMLVAGACLVPPVATATAISQTIAFHLDSNTTSLALSFTPFDPLAGPLKSIEISFDNVTLTHDWWLWNNSSVTPRQVSYNAELQGASLTISDNADGILVPFAPLLYSGTTGFLNRVTLATYLDELNHLTTGAGPPPPPADYFHGSGVTLPPLSGQLPPQNFFPGLNLAFDPGVLTAYDPGSWNVVATNVFTGSRVALDGNVTVTYNVPESFPGSLAVAVWIGLGLIARFRRKARGAA